jgi:hypothetical protein
MANSWQRARVTNVGGLPKIEAQTSGASLPEPGRMRGRERHYKDKGVDCLQTRSNQ